MKQTFPAIAIPIVHSECNHYAAGFLPTMVLYTDSPILPYMAVDQLTELSIILIPDTNAHTICFRYFS
jgi:hypothetical protein